MYISLALVFSMAYFVGVGFHVFALFEAGHLADTDILVPKYDIPDVYHTQTMISPKNFSINDLEQSFVEQKPSVFILK